MINVNDTVFCVFSGTRGEVSAIDDVTALLVVMWENGECTLTEPKDINKVVAESAA